MVHRLRVFISNLLSNCSVVCLQALAKLPLPMQLWLGKLLGIVLYYCLPRRRRIAAANLQLCFPELSPKQLQQLVMECLIENGRGLLESARAWWGNMQPIFDNAEVHGREHLHNLAKDQACLLIGAHFTTLDLGGRIIANVWPLSILYRPFNNKTFDQAVLVSRLQSYHRVIDKNKMRDLVRSVRQCETLWYPADQDYGPKDSVFAPFFDVPAASLATTAGLAKLCDYQLLTVYHHRLASGRYRIEFREIKTDAVDAVGIASAANEAIEAGIRMYPAQYMWIHRRFKTRPAHCKPVYGSSGSGK